MGKELREVYVNTLIDMAINDDRVVLVEADLMKACGTAPFKERFPDRVVDVGVAEANMVGVAAGLSAFGKIPFVNSFTAFATRRCYDQIVISAAFAQQNVKIVGVDPGVGAELNGGTHMSFEDIGIMRNVPSMLIFEPVDETQLMKLLPEIKKQYGNAYIRLFRKATPKIFNMSDDLKLGKAFHLIEGSDVTIIASGLMVYPSLEAVELLKNDGISARLINMHTIKPVDEEAIISAAKETGGIVTAENHNIINGLGSAVAEVLSEKIPVPLARVGVKDHFGEVGKKEFLMEKYDMTPQSIIRAAKHVIAMKNSNN